MTSSKAGADGLSAKIAEHVATARFETLSARTVKMTKLALLDAIGVSLAASGMSPDIRPFVDMSRHAGGAPEAGIIGFGVKVPAVAAAFSNGAMAHAMDFEDSFDRNPCHPNASLVPAVLAICERQGGIDGKALLAAMAIGCDLVCRIGLSFEQDMEQSGWYPPPIIGAFGAVAATSRLLGLPPHRITDAFSLMLCQATCSGEIKFSPNAVVRAVREAFPAQAAVVSADLAARGVTGFDAPFEGEAGFFALYVDGRYNSQILLDQLGYYFHGEELSFKPWPSCRGTHAFIEACLALRAAHRFDWSMVREVRLTGGEVHGMLAHPRQQKVAPRTIIDAKFSLPFTIATALRDGAVTLGSFTPEALEDADLHRLAEMVELDVSPQWPRERAASGEVAITLDDGRRLHHAVDHALGHPANPMSPAQLLEKFRDCAGRAHRPMTATEADMLAGRLLTIETERDVGRVLSEVMEGVCKTGG